MLQRTKINPKKATYITTLQGYDKLNNGYTCQVNTCYNNDCLSLVFLHSFTIYYI